MLGDNQTTEHGDSGREFRDGSGQKRRAVRHRLRHLGGLVELPMSAVSLREGLCHEDPVAVPLPPKLGEAVQRHGIT